jgi:ZIP family zinc transporter
MLLGIALAAFGATFAGGLLALRVARRLQWILGFSAGAVVAVAFFDLLPEALELSAATVAPVSVLAWTVAGFLMYLCLDRAVFFNAHALRDRPRVPSGHPDGEMRARGTLFAGNLSLHSFLDGIGIGLAFQASSAVGLIVAVAVLTHDFSDGLNTMNVVLRNGGKVRAALRWLFADAIAPAIGIAATRFFTVGNGVLGIILALFAGFFLYIGASDLLPESHRNHPTVLTTLMTVLGSAVLYVVITLARN